MYLIKIDKRTPNPEYKPPKGIRGMYNQPYDVHEFIYEKSLEVELTDEEFQAIKKATLEVM